MRNCGPDALDAYGQIFGQLWIRRYQFAPVYRDVFKISVCHVRVQQQMDEHPERIRIGVPPPSCDVPVQFDKRAFLGHLVTFLLAMLIVFGLKLLDTDPNPGQKLFGQIV